MTEVERLRAFVKRIATRDLQAPPGVRQDGHAAKLAREAKRDARNLLDTLDREALHPSQESHGVEEEVVWRAIVREFCEAAEYAAGADEDGIDPAEASSRVWGWSGSPMAVAYDRARAALGKEGV